MAQMPSEVLEALCRGADPRRIDSLKKINAVCEELRAEGSTDFSLRSIGHRSVQRKGPATRAILNPAGAPYRTLIESHRQQAGVKKHRSAKGSKAEADGLLDGIEDPNQRARINLLRTEVASLRRQLHLVEGLAHDSATVTVQATKGDTMPKARTGVWASVKLMPVERDALRDALEPKRLGVAGLTVSANGRMLATNGHIAFPVGFATALQKLAEAFGSQPTSQSFDG